MTGLYAATIRKKLNWKIEDMAWYLNITPLSVEAVEKYGPTKSIEAKLIKLEKAIERKDVGLQSILFRVKNRMTRTQFGKSIGASNTSVRNLEHGRLGVDSKVRKDAEKKFKEDGIDLDFIEEEPEEDDFDIEYYKANAEMWKEYYFEAKSQWMVDNLTRELGLYSSIGRPTDSVYSWELNSNRATQMFDRCKLLERESILWEVATEVDEWAYELDGHGERTGKRTIAPLFTMEAFTKTLMIVDDEIHRMGLIPMHNGSQAPMVETDNWTIIFYNQEDFEELAQ